MKVYIDTNIYIDYFQNREDYIRPLGLFAFTCFSKGWNCSFSLVTSSLIRKEVCNHIPEAQYEEILSEFREVGKLLQVSYSAVEFKKSRSYDNPNDALHALIAIREGCDAIITRNVMDFSAFSRTIDILYPERV